MTISLFAFQLVITAALAITVISPIALVIFWIKDWKDRKLW
jgi:hypothetical protein